VRPASPPFGFSTLAMSGPGKSGRVTVRVSSRKLLLNNIQGLSLGKPLLDSTDDNLLKEVEGRYFDPCDLVIGEPSTYCARPWRVRGRGACRPDSDSLSIDTTLQPNRDWRDAMYPEDVDPESGCRLPLPLREQLDDAARRTYDSLADPKGRSGG
jgi:hypothetical protein